MGLLVLLVLGPINLFVWRTPQQLGLLPDGSPPPGAAATGAVTRTSSTLPGRRSIGRFRLAVRTSRFWWLALGYFCALIAWYAVQVHQTKYLIEVGFSSARCGVGAGGRERRRHSGQVGLGALSDRIGREWVWTAGCAGFAVCYAALIALEHAPAHALLYVMVISQGFLGYALTSVMGPIAAEIFEGPHYGSIFGTITRVDRRRRGRPWITGVLHDMTGQLQTGVSSGDRVLRRFGCGNLDCGPAQSALSARPDKE